jgi:bifunctional DNA-binding transcriptional regulator/antitoxin component of YhaV-PrlF toxin-antitoxin module
MTVAMDKFGRILIPKKMREELHLLPDEPLDLEIENGTLRVSIAPQAAQLRKIGHILVADSQPLEDSREILETIRNERLEELANW